MVIGHIVDLVPVGIENNQKSHPALLLKLLHKLHLVLMDILQAEGIPVALLGVKAYGNPLHRPDIVHRTFLVKIGQGDMPVFLIYFYRRYGRGHLLYQGQSFFSVLFICPVDQILQGRTPKPSGIPDCHNT